MTGTKSADGRDRMSAARSSAQTSAEAERQLKGFIGKFDPKQQGLPVTGDPRRPRGDDPRRTA